MARNYLDHILAVLALQKVLVHVDLALQTGSDVQQHLVLLALWFQVGPDLGQLPLHIADKAIHLGSSEPTALVSRRSLHGLSIIRGNGIIDPDATKFSGKKSWQNSPGLRPILRTSKTFPEFWKNYCQYVYDFSPKKSMSYSSNTWQKVAARKILLNEYLNFVLYSKRSEIDFSWEPFRWVKPNLTTRPLHHEEIPKF